MSRLTIDLPIYVAGLSDWRVVRAKLLRMHVGRYTFALHAAYGLPGCWTVSNIETGCQIATARIAALAEVLAAARLLDKTEADMDRALVTLPAECCR